MNGGLDVCVYDNSGALVGQPGCQCPGGYTGKYCQTKPASPANENKAATQAGQSSTAVPPSENETSDPPPV
jgi:hypothetical protein